MKAFYCKFETDYKENSYFDVLAAGGVSRVCGTVLAKSCDLNGFFLGASPDSLYATVGTHRPSHNF